MEEQEYRPSDIVHFRHNPKAPTHWDLVCWNRTVW